MKMTVRIRPIRLLHTLKEPKPMKWKANSSIPEQAFTRLELMIVLITILALTAIALPTLGGNKARSEQALCFSNLRQIGHAFQLWADDHGDRNPWLTPVSEGGSYESYHAGSPLRDRAWFQMSWISNELVTPK